MGNKYLHVITPDYLKAIIKESIDYSFRVKGFSDCDRAYKNLTYSNQSSILGFLIIYEELPEDLSDLVNLINFLNQIGDKDLIILLCVNDDDGLEDYLLPSIRTTNITFLYTTDYEVMTDQFIKRELFGSILIRRFSPYLDKMEIPEYYSSYNSNKHLTPILPSDILMILSPIVKLSDSHYTILNDVILKDSKDNVLISYIRTNRIKRLFNDEIDYNGMIDRVNNTLNIDKILYKTVCNLVRDGF